MVTADGVHNPVPRDVVPASEGDLVPVRDDRRWTRRNVLRWMIYGGWGVFALAGALPALAIKTLQEQKKAVAAGDKLVFAAGTSAGQALNAGTIPEGQTVQAFPDGKSDNQNNLIQLVKLPGVAANGGLVAYSAICTHLGCAVLPQLNAQGNINCPCHGSVFNPANGAAVVSGPAPRPLPNLPLQVGADGAITAAGAFSGPVGVS